MALETGESTARITGGPTLSCWSFGSVAFDEGRWQLSVGGEVIELERKPLEVLQYLLHHAGEVVTKEELLSTVWEGRIVVEAVLTNAIGKLRKALRDDEQRIILTLPRVGYRLDAKVSRRVVDHVPAASRLSVGDTVPRRSNWRLEEALARGGDGEVWLARHIKTGQTRVFKFSLDGSRLVGLKREVTVGRLLEQALGQRPDLVRVIDWDFEQAPFFVEFEYGGVSLDRWLETIGSSAPLDARLALFIEAANAVAAAHGVGVLHKDLKPANLLVYGTPDDWHLRVADFGSSRVFEAGLLDNLGITRLGFTQTQVLSADTGTPLYMAPEVLGGQSPTIKSDVYALGLTLYQLIIGDFRRPLSAGWENDVTDPLLRRDVADAADGDPDKRLDSAAQLAARIRTLAERRQKAALEAAIKDRVAVAERRASLARARRPWVVAAMLLLIAGMTTSLYYARQSRQQTRRALAATNEATVEADKAKVADTKATSINTFLLQNVISASDPMRSGNHAITLQQALDQAEPKIHTSFAKQPDLEIEVRTLLADAYVAHGDWEHVLDQCNKIIALAAVHPNDATYVGQGNKARLRQAEALLFLGRLTEFDRAMAPLLKQVEDGNLTDPDVRYHAYYYAGQRTMMAGDYVRTVQLLQKAHNEVQMLHMPGQPDAEAGAKIQVDSELGQALGLAGRNDESLNLLTNLRKQVAASHGDAFPANLDVRDSLVGTEIAVGHYADAQRDLDSLRQDSNRVLGSDSSLSSHLDYNQGWIFVNQNLYAKAIPFYANAYATQRAQDGGSDPQTVMIGVQYADVTRIAGSMSQAQQVLETMDNDIRPLPGGTRAPLQAQVALVRGCLMVDQGRASQARALAQSLDASTVNSDDSAVKRLKGLRQSDDIQRITCALAMQG